jgi:hypothetical protein
VPERITEDAWAPFGWLPVADTDPRDGAHRMTFEWADPHVNLIGHTLDEVPETERGLRCEMLYRHDTHTQSLLCINVPAVIAVAPAGVEFTEAADAESIRAFRLEPLDSLVLHAPEVRLFNVQGLRYADDNRRVDLAAKGLSVEVDLR